jgi:hypothetical protein
MTVEKGFGAKGDENLTTIKLSYEFINVDNPSEKLAGSFEGCGSDKGDKGAYKAITGALKYALTSTFLIETGDDPEKEDRQPEPEQVQKQFLNKEERAEASKAAQQVGQRKIQAIREESPAPVVEKPARLQATLDRITDKNSGLATLSDWYMELTEAIGAKPAEAFSNSLKKRLGVSSSSEMNVEQLRQSVEMIWRKIEEGKQDDPLKEIVKDMPIGVGADAPMWVDKPSAAAKAGVEAHNSHIEAEKRRKAQ